MTESIKRTSLPVVGVTMGDPAGIGPEVIVKSLADVSIRRSVRPIVVGDKRVLADTCRSLGLSLEVTGPVEGDLPAEGVIEVIDLANCDPTLEIGKVSPVSGRAAGEYIRKAFELRKDGIIDAISTAPINKESLNSGGFEFPGHTEFLASLAGVEKFAMSFFAGDLRVVLLSTHLPLKEAIANVSSKSITELISFADRTLSQLLGRKVAIAVAGLNPHASENGKFGDEEAREIAPAIEECRGNGIKVSGPYSPDTIFLRGYKGEFDAVIAHYHDQATIPVKALSFGSAVNVTLGLPFIRTSVDHGTAFDIAGKGVADPSSMKAAIMLAGELAIKRKSGR